MKLNRSLISPTLNQAIVASYLKEGTYHRHLKKLRKTIRLQRSYRAAALTRHFPETIKTTSPLGGQSIWIELPDGVKGREVYFSPGKRESQYCPVFCVPAWTPLTTIYGSTMAAVGVNAWNVPYNRLAISLNGLPILARPLNRDSERHPLPPASGLASELGIDRTSKQKAAIKEVWLNTGDP